MNEKLLEFRRKAIGKSYMELQTPALLLHLDIAKSNIVQMAERMKEFNCNLRPHVKTHKSPHLAKLQMEAGAIGLTAATVWEAAVMVRFGIRDVLIANQVVGSEKVRLVAEIARESHISVAVDDFDNANELSKAALNSGSEIGVLVDLDVGMGRCGVRDQEEGVRLAEAINRLPGLKFEGVMGYEGHCMLEPDRSLRVEKARIAMQDLFNFAQKIENAGIPVGIVSAGGTGTYDITGANPNVTELQAGSYVLMDAFHSSLMPIFPVASTVLATIISKQGDTIILDTGRKSVGAELMLPTVKLTTAMTMGIAEEHLIVQINSSEENVKVGDHVEVVPGYGPTTVNLHDVFYVVEDGIVKEVWPVYARESFPIEYRRTTSSMQL